MKKEIIGSGFWLLLALYLCRESFRLGIGSATRPGPGFFPLGAALAVAIIAIFRWLNIVRRKSTLSTALSDAAGEWKKIVPVLGGMLFYALLLESLGLVICTFVLVAFYLKAIAAQRWLVSLSFAFAVALTSHLFFDVLLIAQLPRGLLALFD